MLWSGVRESFKNKHCGYLPDGQWGKDSWIISAGNFAAAATRKGCALTLGSSAPSLGPGLQVRCLGRRCSFATAATDVSYRLA